MLVTIQFVGGPFEGTVTFDPAAASEGMPQTAWTFYQMTDGCKFGKAAMAGNAATIHPYRVIERKESDDGLFVRAKAF
ncbi:MAG: hypothetical protein WD847_15140 [Pirellulales bacterium]